jgi:hypothetical protein
MKQHKKESPELIKTWFKYLSYLKIIATAYVSLYGLSVIPSRVNREVTNPNEKSVLLSLKRILGKDICINIEKFTLKEKSKQSDFLGDETRPDFNFILSGINIFIEVGGRNNQNMHKRNQLNVVKNGLIRNAEELLILKDNKMTDSFKNRITDVIYVQLDKNDVCELTKIQNEPDLLTYLQTRKIFVSDI